MTLSTLAEPPSIARPPAALAPDRGLVFALERPQDHAVVEALIDRAFGPGRFAKTAERLREGSTLRADLSICAWHGDQLVGAARQWPIRIGLTPAVFLGPFAVETAWRSHGLGATLIARAGQLADAAGETLTLLVGAQSYFGPLGYSPAPAGRLVMPGPVDPRRLLWRPAPGANLDQVHGPVRIPPAG